MATVNIAFGRANTPTDMGPAPVIDASSRTVTVTSSGTSAVAQTATAADFEALSYETAAVVTVTGGAVWVRFGSAPTAVVDGDGCFLILDGQTRDFGRLTKGFKVAVINDA